jgi:hypothetical protein
MDASRDQTVSQEANKYLGKYAAATPWDKDPLGHAVIFTSNCNAGSVFLSSY